MIINCIKCNKSFELESNLIPEEGRLLQCGSCYHKWFFKHKIEKSNEKIESKNTHEETNDLVEKNEPTEKVQIDNNETKQEKNLVKEKDINEGINININDEDDFEKESVKENNNYTESGKKKVAFTNILVVFIISFIALIILLDTFKEPISSIIPNIDLILINLYETVKDIFLFIKDLI